MLDPIDARYVELVGIATRPSFANAVKNLELRVEVDFRINGSTGLKLVMLLNELPNLESL